MSKKQETDAGSALNLSLWSVLLYLLFLVSGFAALVYQVAWLKVLGLLFGNTARAAAATLAVFFLGLAAGSAVGGRWAARSRKVLRLYAWVEVGIAASAALCFLLSTLYRYAYSSFFAVLIDSPGLALALEFALTLLLLFPAAFFLGTTLPLMGQVVVRRPSRLGVGGAGLYAVNILGAALGAFTAGFYLLGQWGFTRTYLLAMGLNLGIAAIAWALSGRIGEEPRAFAEVDVPPVEPATSGLSIRGLYGLAFLSGLLTLALEVLWTRMLSQVFHNSVYSFAAILVVFLVSLGLGSLLAQLLARSRGGEPVLAILMVLAGILVSAFPFVFWDATQGMRYLGTNQDWGSYVATLFRTTAIGIFAPALLAGAVFPYLFKLAERFRPTPGLLLGRLAAFNTLGAIAGSLLAGFVMLQVLGLWKSLQVVAAFYVLAAALVFESVRGGGRWARVVPILMMVLVAGQLAAYSTGYLSLPLTRLRSDLREELVEEWEGSQGTVAVVERGRTRGRPGVLTLRLNNHYTLGTNASLQFERGQADLPMLIHPAPKKVFFLGMGTGVTAGAALQYPVSRVVVTEIVPEVIQAARRHFRPYVGSLFEDGRVSLLSEDGRNVLQASPERFDVIIGDLFVPWGSGTASLYSREHFQTIRSRLEPGGVFAQWLPCYQLSRREFSIIARTMLEVFPRVTLWRGDFFASRPIVALIGQEEGAQLSPDALTRIADLSAEGPEMQPGQVLPFLLYAGNLTSTRSQFEGYPLNTDDRPVIEYVAPRTHRSAEENRWLTSLNLVQLYEQLREGVPFEEDPYLSRLSDQQRDFVQAGYFFYRGAVLFRNGRRQEAQSFFEEFARRVPVSLERLPSSLAREPEGDPE